MKKLKDEKTKEQLVQTISYELEQLKMGNKPDQIFKYLSLAYEDPASLIDYLPVNGLVFLDEISRIQEINDSLEKEEAGWYTDLLSQGQIIHDIKVGSSHAGINNEIQQAVCIPFIIFTACTAYESSEYPEFCQ